MQMRGVSRFMVLSVLGSFCLVLGLNSALAFGSSSNPYSQLSTDAVALAYFVADESTTVWVITNDGVQATNRIAVSRDELANLVRDFREDIESPSSIGKELVAYLETVQKAARLYELLVSPAEMYLEEARHIVIVPSDVLFYLPFGALYRCPTCTGRDFLGGEFLVERFSISYASSLCSLHLSAPLPERGELRSVLAVGNLFGGLPYTEEEIEVIVSLFPESTVIIEEEATEGVIKTLLHEKRYDVVHISTHCFLLDCQDPFLSGIVLREGEGEDGILRASEILGLNTSVDLLVISASLYAAALDGGEAFRVVQDVFLSAGVASTLIPLWNVNDRSTRHLMETMYKGLMAEASKGEALRKAQLSLLQDPLYRHPYYWSPFVLYGDWRGAGLAKPPDTGKLDYELYKRLVEWKRKEHLPDEAPPVIPVLITLNHSATQEDLEAFKSLSEEIDVRGSFGYFVQLQVPLSLLEVVAALPQVRSVSPPAETILN